MEPSHPGGHAAPLGAEPPWGALYPFARAATMKESTSKVTVLVPTALLQQARAITREGITGTVRHGLRQLVAVHAQRELRKVRGRVAMSLDLETVREDRHLDHGKSPPLRVP